MTAYKIKSHGVRLGHYSISDQLGYRQYIDVCVAYWPEKSGGVEDFYLGRSLRIL
jgi:hypothetical protein